MSKKSKKSWMEYVEQLNETNYSYFNELKEYIDCSDSMYERKDECLEEILDLMISAQQDGVAIESVIGSDRQKFCENMLRSISDTNNAQRIALRIFSFGMMAIVMGLLDLAIAHMNISTGAVRDGKINILHPFLIAILVMGIDWGMEIIIRRQLIKKNKHTLYKKRAGIEVLLFCLIGIIGGIFSNVISDSMGAKDWLFVNISVILLIGGAIALFSMICFIMLSAESGNWQDYVSVNEEKQTKRIVELLEKKYQNKKKRLEEKGQFIEDSENRDKFERKYLKQCRVAHYLFLLDFIATLGLLSWSMQMKTHENFLIIVILVLIVISGYGFSMEHKQKKSISNWRRMKS